MAASTTVDSAVSNPGGTGSSLTVTLPTTQAVNDILFIMVSNTGNAAWTGNPTGWSRLIQFWTGTSSNGVMTTVLYRKLVSGDTLPLNSPVCTLGGTVTRSAISWTERGADIEGIFVLPEWGANVSTSGTSNPISPASVTTRHPEMHVLHCYSQRAATNAPEPTGYTQLTNGEVIISGTLVSNVSQKTVADQNIVLSGQTVSPTSGARWGAVMICIPSPDYPYYRSGAQANASATSVTPALPTGTSSSDWRSNKDLVVATVEAAGTAPSPNTPGDWTEVGGVWSGTTSGGATTVRKYWALYDGTLDRQFNRTGSGEISVCLTTYRNCDQTNPIGAFDADARASSTTSTWDAVTRINTKVAVQATCVADATPTFTSPSGWTERMDGLGITCSDQTFDATGSSASASFTLSTASPTLVGLLELKGVSSVVIAAIVNKAVRINQAVNRSNTF